MGFEIDKSPSLKKLYNTATQLLHLFFLSAVYLGRGKVEMFLWEKRRSGRMRFLLFIVIFNSACAKAQSRP
jgi:hypothetical protein